MSTDQELAAGIAATGRWFMPGRDAPVLARRFARGFLASSGADTRCQQIAELLVSELVTNAVVHAHSMARLRVSAAGSTARVEVSDDGPGRPRLRDPGDDGGWGLRLVDWLARSWGADSRGGRGKTVWFTLPLAAAPPP